jgi:hypothetical protein
VPRYRKRPVEIEAAQFTGSNGLELLAEGWADEWSADHAGDLVIHTLEGDHRANPGDWIIRGVKGERYPCKPDIFEATYERVPDPSEHLAGTTDPQGGAA